jgi:hypothetical protein
VRVLTVHTLIQLLACLPLLIKLNSTLNTTSNMSSTKDESSRASHEESSDVPKPKDRSEAAHILSFSRDEVDDNPSREQIHMAAKVSCFCLCTILVVLCLMAVEESLLVLSETLLSSLRTVPSCDSIALRQPSHAVSKPLHTLDLRHQRTALSLIALSLKA